MDFASLRAVKNFAPTSAAKPLFVRAPRRVQASPPVEKIQLNIPHTPKKDIHSENMQPVYGVLLQTKLGRSLQDGKRLFLQGNYWLASEIIMESYYTSQALADLYYLNWLLKSLLAVRRLELVFRYLKQYRLQPGILRESKNPRDSELYYLIGSNYIPNSYYWIARTVYLLMDGELLCRALSK